jgi:hypothetical protein
MKAICFSETSVFFERTTRRYIPEDSTLREIEARHCKGAHTQSIMLRKIVLRNTSLPIHDQVNQHHTRSTSCTTRNVAQRDWSCMGPLSAKQRCHGVTGHLNNWNSCEIFCKNL